MHLVLLILAIVVVYGRCSVQLNQIATGCECSTLLRNVGWYQISAPRFQQQQRRENLKNFTIDVLGPRSQVMSLGPLLRDTLFMLYSWQRQSPPAARQRSRICHLLLPYDVMYPNTGPTHTIRKVLCQCTVDSEWQHCAPSNLVSAGQNLKWLRQ